MHRGYQSGCDRRVEQRYALWLERSKFCLKSIPDPPLFIQAAVVGTVAALSLSGFRR